MSNLEGDNVFVIHRKIADVGKKIENNNEKKEVLGYGEQRRRGERRP